MEQVVDLEEEVVVVDLEVGVVDSVAVSKVAARKTPNCSLR